MSKGNDDNLGIWIGLSIAAIFILIIESLKYFFNIHIF